MLKKTYRKGLTLVELTVTVAVLTIISIIAEAMYSKYIEKSKIASTVSANNPIDKTSLYEFYNKHNDSFLDSKEEFDNNQDIRDIEANLVGEYIKSKDLVWLSDQEVRIVYEII